MSFNKFKSTTVYGDFNNKDLDAINTSNANAIFDRNVSVKGTLQSNDCSLNTITLNGNITTNSVTISPTELSYLNDCSSNIQGQINSVNLDISSNYLNLLDASNNYLKLADASNDYLTKSDASNNYLIKTDASNNYLTQGNAESTYFPKIDANDDYLRQGDADNIYLTKMLPIKIISQELVPVLIILQKMMPIPTFLKS